MKTILSCQAILMLIIMLLEVAAIICGYIFYNKIEDRIKEMLHIESLNASYL